MKRFLSLMLTLSLLLGMGGCALSRDKLTDGNAIAFYYESREAEALGSEETVASETRYLSVISLQEVLIAYFQGPESESLVSPFPAGTSVLSVDTIDNVLTLEMSGEFFTLMGVEMSVASCCLASTVCAYTGGNVIRIVDEMGTIQMDVQPDHYLLSNHFSEESDKSFTVYFSDLDQRYLISETRDVTLSENETEMAYVMRQLIEGPDSDQLESIIPPGTELLEVTCKDGVCTLNLSREFYTNRLDDTYGAYMTLYGITDTLTSLSGVDSVLFLVNGSTIDHYGIFSLARPLTRNTDAIGPVRTTSGEIDANIYVLTTDEMEPFAVPCRIKQSASEPMAEAVISKMLDYEPPSGFFNPIPYGTELLGIGVSGSVCYVDLSDKFVPQEDTEETEQAAVWALVTSLTDLDNISSVVLTIDGDSNGLKYVDISEPLTRHSVSMD